MSIPSESRGRRKGERQRCRSCFLCPKYGGCGWDIAEYVMYCHLCGALSETCNTFMGYTAVRLRTAFVFYNEAQSSYYFNFIKISEQIYCDSCKISKIDINFAPASDFEQHPYMSRKAAKLILETRESKGGWNSIEEMQSENIFTEEQAKAIAPYLLFGTTPQEFD